jgi:lipopolysaccharide export LptBFGC system permease protein LptF
MLGAATFVGWRRGQLSRRFLTTASIMVMSLAAVCAALLYGRQAGYSRLYLLPAILPFVISGCVVLMRLFKPPAAAPTEPPEAFRSGAEPG